MEIIIILVVVAVLIAGWFAVSYNGFVKIKNGVEEAFATMDVYLKKRFDLIPNLVETVKGYAAHEAGTLEKVISARNQVQSATTVEDKLANENILTGTLRNLFALAESYPDLKANTNFLDLQQQLLKVEDDIANSRKYYNAMVRTFNTKCESFPSLIIANIFKFVKKPMFEVDDESERKNVKVQF